jgi:hypothetical protein
MPAGTLGDHEPHLAGLLDLADLRDPAGLSDLVGFVDLNDGAALTDLAGLPDLAGLAARAVSVDLHGRRPTPGIIARANSPPIASCHARVGSE